MLRQLRSAEKMKRILWIGLLVLIIPSLVAFYGFGSGGGTGPVARNQVVATIKYPEGSKAEIGSSELRTARGFLQNRLMQYGQAQGMMIDPQAASELTDERAILEQAIDLDILRNFAETHGLTVSTEEVIASIQEVTTPEQRQQLYQQWAMQGLTVDSVIEDERKSRVLQRASEAIGAKVRVTSNEAWDEYVLDNEQLVVDTYRFSPSDFISSVTITEEGTNSYYEENKETFRVPDQVQYEYVIVRRDDLKSSITLTDDEITSYYTSNQEEFRLPRKVIANQILLKLPTPEETNTTSAAELTSMTEAVRLKADDIYQRAAAGEDFATLANEFNQETNFPPRADAGTTASDAITTAGGYLGLISEDVARTWYEESWTSTVFSMDPTSVTQPIRTPLGFHIVKVQEIVQGEIQPLAEVRTVIENQLREQKVGPLFDSIGNRLEEITGNVTGLQAIAAATSQTVATSGKVSETDKFIPGIGLLGEFEESIRDLNKGGHSDVLSDSQRHLVIQIKEEFPSHIPALADIKARVEQAYKQKLAEDMAKAQAEELLKKSSDFAAFQQAVSDLGTTYTRSRPFKRAEAAAIFGGPVTDFRDLSAGAAKGDIKMVSTGRPGQQQSFIVWHLDQVIEPSKAEFTRDLSQITEQLAQKKRQILVLEYIRDQRKKLTDRIEIDDYYNQSQN